MILSKKSLGALLLLASFQARAGIVLYGGLGPGSVTVKETQTGGSFDHTSSFFTGHWTYGFGARTLINLSHFDLGLVAEGSWVGDSVDRQQKSVVNDVTYRYESLRLLGGISTAIKVSSWQIVAEYYPYLQNTISFSDDRSENPYRKNDKLKGTGFGIGAHFPIFAGFGLQFMFRRLTHNDVEMNGVQKNLPNTNFSEQTTDEILAQVTKSF